jgi:protein-S-isoprenylcysteine O-methyltransferase Ste14
MLGALALLYGTASYALFFVTFLYAIGFVGNLVVPRSIDAGGPSAGIGSALLVNLVLLGIFAVQHSVMARPGFKKAWTKVIPKTIERSTYVLLTCGALILMFALWRPMPGVVWSLESSVGRMLMTGLFWTGWVIVFLSTFMINHFDLFGLRQVWLRFREQPYSHLNFVKVWLYQYVRHPIMFGFLIAFWATPDMTHGHLLFAIMTTGYILIALRLEERDLMAAHPETYGDYRQTTPMLLPFTRRGS